MPRYCVDLKDTVCYDGIEADTEEEAIEMALEWWSNRTPDISCEEE